MSTRIPDRDVRKVVRQAQQHGWTVRYNSNNHLTLIPPDPNAEMVVVGSTPSDWRSIRNLVARIRRIDPDAIPR